MRNFIGVDLGGTNIRAAIVSEDGTIKCMKKSESHPERGAEAVMETMISLIESLDGYEECEGIGMVFPDRSTRSTARSSFLQIFQN